ncbi:hypothetical protein ACIQ4I_02445 [Rummeliibacillus sp. NPDC094406]
MNSLIQELNCIAENAVRTSSPLIITVAKKYEEIMVKENSI